MKPRTKLQHEVVRLSRHLPEITKAQMEWAYKYCLNHYGFATKKRVICFDCGERFSTSLVRRNRATCPHCGTRIDVIASNKRKDKQGSYFAIATIYQDYQVIRNFELWAYYKDGEKVRYFLHEILQHWLTPDGKKVEMIGLLHNTNGYSDSWSGEWTIRKERGWYRKYDVTPYRYHPDSKFKPEFKKIGLNHRMECVDFFKAIRIIPVDPHAETLLKVRQYSLLSRLLNKKGYVSAYWPSIKICLRNKYKVKDASMWIDYLELLRYFRRDLRNAKYVCPSNLKKEHDRLVEKKRNIERKQKLKEQRRRLAEAQRDYDLKKKAFFGLIFSHGEIEVKFLNSVKEVMEEGDTLNHCVFASNYHQKDNSLLFSAEVNHEKNATIEVSLSDFKILQVRGKSNKVTPYDGEIRSIIKKNIPVLKKAAEQLKSA